MGDAKSAAKIYSKEVEKNLKKIAKEPAHKVAVDCMHAAILSSGGKLKEAATTFNTAM